MGTQAMGFVLCMDYRAIVYEGALVAAFADLFAEGFDVEGDVDDGEGVSPCGGVEPVAFDEGSVDVGEDGFYHWAFVEGLIPPSARA